MKKFALLLAGLSLLLVGCGGQKVFTKGSYDDPERVELLDDKFNEADMQQMARQVVEAVVDCYDIRTAPKRPTVAVSKVANRTEEHIDVAMITEMIQSELTNSGKVRFIDRAAREELESEYNYGDSGNVSERSKKRRGKQIGVDYLLRGAIATNVQEVGSDKFVYYKLNMKLTNVSTSTIDCQTEKQVRKKYKKRRVGL